MYKGLKVVIWLINLNSIFDELLEDDKITFLDMLQSYFKKCENCGKYFIPRSRSDEKYCNRIYKGKMTCKQSAYENKDDYVKVYRTAYKTKNALKNKSKLSEDVFYDWVYKAKIKLNEVRKGKITPEEFYSFFE